MRAHPLLIPNAKGRSQSVGARCTEMEGGSKDPCHTWYAWAHIRWENIPEIRCRPSSMTSGNISDGNKRSHPTGMNAIIMHLLDGRRPQIRGSAISDTLVPICCTSRVVGDSERDPLHLELIYPVIGEAATAQHTITNQPIIHNLASLSTDLPTPLKHTRSPIKRGPRTSQDSPLHRKI